ncbi:MAG: site-specific integrase [Desulfosoma sp.]
MAAIDTNLKAVLEGYADFLGEKKLAPHKHQPHLVRWVRQFLLYAREHGGYTFEQTLNLFLSALGKRAGVEAWQIQQAADAIRIYRYQYRGEGGPKEEKLKDDSVSGSDERLLDRLREVIRLRHYAKSTEKSYLQWTRRFLAYRKHAGLAGEPAVSDVKAFLTRLAMVKNVSASTQNQAFRALLLFFRELLRKDLNEMGQTVEIQELLGHKSLETTMIYTHVARELKTNARSPLDDL